MKQTKQFLRPLLMAIVMLVGMLMPQGAWAQYLGVWEEETISSDANYDMIDVYPGGVLIINEGVTLTVTSGLYTHDDYLDGNVTVINYGTIIGDGHLGMHGGVLANHGHIDLGGADGNGTFTFYNTGTLGENIDFTPTDECNHDYEDLGEVDASCTHGAGTQYRCFTCYYMWLDETSGALPHNINSHNGMHICSSCGHTTYDAPTVGEGTAESPYQIANAGNLFWFADKVNNDYENFKEANAVLTADIVVNDGTFADDGAFTATGASEPSTPIEWLIIARFEKYRGIFDGQGHTISGLYANYECSGLVGMSSGESKIKNVGVINSYFASIENVGGICGDAGNNTEISNCYSSNVICKGPYVGGILGYASNAGVSIVNCYSTASLIGVVGWGQVGGIAGASGSTTNCYTTYGNVTGWSKSENNCEANVTLERFASGEIAYKLNGSIDGEGNWTAGATDGTQKWYQKLGENGDSYPVLAAAEGNTVYEQKTIDCGGTVVACNYNNTEEEDVTQPHDYHVLLDENEKPVFVWSDYYTTATLQLVCSRDAEHTAGVEVTLGEGITWVDTPATCTAAGVRTFTATATYEGETYTGTAIVATDPIAEHTLDEHNVCTECGHGFIFFEKERSYDIEPENRYAFSNSEGSVEYIGNTTFNEWMCAFEFSGLVTEIGNNAFTFREALTAIYLPEVTTIGDDAFNGCGLRDNVSLPKATTIGQAAFLGCGFQTLSLPEATTIGYAAFGSCGNLSSIELPKATTIGDNAFMECDNLNSITVACAADLRGAEIPEGATITRVHDFSSKTLTDEPVADGLHAYACDNGCGQGDEHRFIKDFNGAGNHLELTKDGEGNYSTSEDITLADANGFVSPVDFTAASVTYTRTGIKNQWGTIVVPFDVTGSDEYDFYTLTSATNEELTLTKVNGTLNAGTPALIRINTELVTGQTYNLELNSAEGTVTVNAVVENGSPADGLTLTGSYEVKDITGENGYIISNNKFWSIQDVKGEYNVYCAPFRAYIAGTVANSPQMLSISWKEATPTVIETLEAITEGEAEYYDLNGRRIPELRPGANIVKYGNGITKKVIIK